MTCPAVVGTPVRRDFSQKCAPIATPKLVIGSPAIKNKATTGAYVLDSIDIRLSPFGYGLRDGLLPLPPPAQ